MRKISFILIMFFVLSFNSNLVKYAWGSPPGIAGLFCNKLLKTNINESIKELYLGQCLFLNNANKQSYDDDWNDFSHVAIFIDEALWYRIVTNEDNTKRRAFMEYFAKMVKRAIETASAPPNTVPRFILVNKNGNVMARGTFFLNGEMIPNFVDPVFWNSR